MAREPQETPVYLFLGFLEAGKTKFIQETLEDKRFDSGEKTLVILFEEGEEEYDQKRFKVRNVVIRALEKEDMTEEKLLSLQKETGATRIMVEYNGMWLVQEFFDAMPEGWMINQMMTFFDGNTFLTFNQNMRQLVFDKIQPTQLVVFNRFPQDADKMAYHKICRAISRRVQIVYEYDPQNAEYDEIEDPLPYDLNAPVVDIADRDYAYFYQDFAEETKKYIGKTLHFKGMVAVDKKVPSTNVVIGRHVMTCCEADIAYRGIGMTHSGKLALETRDWVEVTGNVVLGKHPAYRGKGPVLMVTKIEKCAPPEPQLATFD